MTLTPLRKQSLTSNGKAAIGVRARPDLVAVETKHKHDSAVVVKDPIAMKYHRLRPDEYFLLQRLVDGATLESLRDAYEERYTPQKVKLSDLNDLLFRFHKLGLTVSNAPAQGDRLREKQIKEKRSEWMQYLSGVLFIRFPGVDPEPLLRRLYPWVRPILSSFGMMCLLGLGLAALVALSANWPRFMSEFPEMQQWLQLRAVFILAAVIGTTKILHELGHAVTCKHFGGECHQIGPMLLVFTPALYCDTSDSWTLPNRFHRAAVGLAGIGTEVLLASIATLIWAHTGPTLVHYIAMNVMLVCGVSTVLFNANPLLRYDGYYVLSDLCDVPNLGQKSRGLLSRAASRLMFGVDEEENELIGNQERFWLYVYSIAAFFYRWSLTIVIFWLILLILRPYRLDSIGTLLCVFAAGGMLFTTLKAPFQFLRHPGRRRQIKMKRTLITGLVFTVLAVGACWPIPSGENANGRVVPRKEIPIYVSTSGHLDELLSQSGQNVQKDDVVARLVNPDVELEYVKAAGRVQTQRQRNEALESSQLTMNEVANELPAAKVLLEELERQLESRQTRRDALSIKSPASGRLLSPPKLDGTQPGDSELTLARWSGDPTDASNRGCFIESGTELFSIVVDNHWDAELLVSADSVQRIERGNQVKLVLESKPEQPLYGTVSEISLKEWSTEENRERRDSQQAVRQNQPVETSYAVRVHLDADDPALLTGAEVAARIEAKPISMVGRGVRFLNRLLRFR